MLRVNSFSRKFTAWRQSIPGVSSENPARDRKSSSTTRNCPGTWNVDCTNVTELALRTSSCWRISAASPLSSAICANDSTRISFMWVKSVINSANLKKFLYYFLFNLSHGIYFNIFSLIYFYILMRNKSWEFESCIKGFYNFNFS